MDKVSVVIPARNEQFLQNTITDLLSKAEGEVEVIPVLDGYWPNPPLHDDPRIFIIHRGLSRGMRNGITSAVAIATGKYILKSDGHCLWDQGWDTKLKANCEKNWVVVPRRKRLDAENWCIQDVGKPDIDYMYLSYPDDPNDFGGKGLNGKNWDSLTLERLGKPEYDIDDLMSAQGSAWFMHKDYFYELELMDEKNYGTFWNEFQEIGLKCWLSGGRVVVNKHTWYAHLHKGKKYGRGYHLNEKELTKGSAFTKKWFNFQEAWPKQTLPLSWLIRKFMPVPGWTEEKIRQLEKGKIIEETKPMVKKESKKPDTLKQVLEKYSVGGKEKMPIEIPNVGRDNLAQLFAELGLNKGVEVGTERGKYAEVLCKANPKIQLYCVDPWITYDNNEGYKPEVTQEMFDECYEETKARLAPYNATLIRKKSMEAVEDFEDESLDFVYIDGNHRLEDVINDISKWSKKIRSGGIISGHDYKRFTRQQFSHVVEAMKAYTESYLISPWFVLGRKETLPGEVRDSARSWMFIKP